MCGGTLKKFQSVKQSIDIYAINLLVYAAACVIKVDGGRSFYRGTNARPNLAMIENWNINMLSAGSLGLWRLVTANEVHRPLVRAMDPFGYYYSYEVASGRNYTTLQQMAPWQR